MPIDPAFVNRLRAIFQGGGLLGGWGAATPGGYTHPVKPPLGFDLPPGSAGTEGWNRPLPKPPLTWGSGGFLTHDWQGNPIPVRNPPGQPPWLGYGNETRPLANATPNPAAVAWMQQQNAWAGPLPPGVNPNPPTYQGPMASLVNGVPTASTGGPRPLPPWMGGPQPTPMPGQPPFAAYAR